MTFHFKDRGDNPPFLYLLQTYIVTSKPKRISVAFGVDHMALLLSFRFNEIIRLWKKIYNNIGLIHYEENH
jgi:hypothetical protein